MSICLNVSPSKINEDVTSTKSTVQDTAGTVSLVGNYQVNNVVTAQLIDIDGNGVNSISSYQWVMHNSGSDISTAVNIDGETAFTYTPVIADIGKLLNIKIWIAFIKLLQYEIWYEFIFLKCIMYK